MKSWCENGVGIKAARGGSSMYPLWKPAGFLCRWAMSLAAWPWLFAISAADDDVHTITLSGRPLPGFGSNEVTHTTAFGDAVLNKSGQVAYLGRLEGASVEPRARESYWR